MNTIYWTSRSAMNASEQKLQVISNNIANSTTTGYKKVQANFSDLLYENIDRKGVPNSRDNNLTAPSHGNGVRISSTVRNHSQGSLLATGLSTNVAIDGEGYFRVKLGTPINGQEYGYTRNGSFQVDVNGNIVDEKGNFLDINFLPGYENTKFTEDNFSIGSNGDIYVSNENTTTKVGSISLYNSIGSGGFVSVADSLYIPADGSNVYKDESSKLYQGYLENSNVDMADELSNLIITQRVFQMNSKMLQTGDEMYGMVNNLRK